MRENDEGQTITVLYKTIGFDIIGCRITRIKSEEIFLFKSIEIRIFIENKIYDNLIN